MEKSEGFMYRTEEEIATRLLMLDIMVRQSNPDKKEKDPMEVRRTELLDMALDIMGIPVDCSDFCDRAGTKKCPYFYMNSKKTCRKYGKFFRDLMYDSWEAMTPDIEGFINHVKAEYFSEDEIF